MAVRKTALESAMSIIDAAAAIRDDGMVQAAEDVAGERGTIDGDGAANLLREAARLVRGTIEDAREAAKEVPLPMGNDNGEVTQ